MVCHCYYCPVVWTNSFAPGRYDWFQLHTQFCIGAGVVRSYTGNPWGGGHWSCLGVPGLPRYYTSCVLWMNHKFINSFTPEDKHNSLWSDKTRQDKPLSKHSEGHHCWPTNVISNGRPVIVGNTQVHICHICAEFMSYKFQHNLGNAILSIPVKLTLE